MQSPKRLPRSFKLRHQIHPGIHYYVGGNTKV